LGDCTSRLSLCFRFSSVAEGWSRSRTMVEMPAVGTRTLRSAREGGGRGCPLVWGPRLPDRMKPGRTRRRFGLPGARLHSRASTSRPQRPGVDGAAAAPQLSGPARVRTAS
jgi:hypothetical protein